jgi:hypothetical protein
MKKASRKTTTTSFTICNVYYLCVLKHNCICGFQECPDLVFVHGPLFSVLSFLPQKFLWLNEEVLSLLCFFLIVGMEFS